LSLLILGITLLSLTIAGTGASAKTPGVGLAGHAKATPTGTYRNPLNIAILGQGRMTNCADPAVFRGQRPGDTGWYAYCSSDALSDKDTKVHLIPMLTSPDLVHWKYVGDALTTTPAWVDTGSPLQSPEVKYFNNHYYLYYAAPETVAGGGAVGVLTSDNPAGPWTDGGGPVVEPHAPPCCPYDKMSISGPTVVDDSSQRYIFYGGFFGGIQARKLSADGLHSVAASQSQITIDNEFEGARIVKHGGYYYLFVSAGNCCNGPLSGYGVFAGRSTKVLGPYVDRTGHSLMDGRAGSSPVLSMNGNRWVGGGHGAVVTDFSGQDWFLYAAIDRSHPYLAGAGVPRHDKRQLMMDPLDWINGWPIVRGGFWASDAPQWVPAAQSGAKTKYRPSVPSADKSGAKFDGLSDDFTRPTVGPQWRWLRQPPSTSYGVEKGTLRMDTVGGDLDSTTAPILLEPAPKGEYGVETKVSVSVPKDGCCFNYAQGGLVIYGNDENYVTLTDLSNWDTRITEFAVAMKPIAAGYPLTGSTQVGPPGDWTWLRILKRSSGNEELYRAYTSADGITWERGGVWTHRLGAGARIGLVAMAASGFTVHFGYVHVYVLSK
jgi:arabinan endo-1,5-alpha-L-arabinosidase